MPILKSAKKANRKAQINAVRNRDLKTKFRNALKNLLNVAKSGDVKKAAEMLPSAQKAIDKAAKRNVIHKNTAARYKARVSKAVSIKK